MKKYLVLSSFLSLTACTAHVGYNDIGQVFRPLAYQQGKPSAQQCAFYATKRAAEKAEADFVNKQNLLSSLKTSLPQNPAWNGHSCQKPQVKPLPPEPKDMSLAQAEFQANGSCLDLLTRRHTPPKIMQSLIAVRQEHLWASFEEWKKAPKESCAMSYMPSQALDFFVRMCGAFGYEASNACLMDYMTECKAKAVQACRSNHIAWQYQVENIKAEPGQLFYKCQSNLEQIDFLEGDLPRLQMTAQLNREEHQKMRRPNVPEASCR